MSVATVFVAGLENVLELNEQLWTEPVRTRLPSAALDCLPMESHDDLLSKLDYDSARVRAFMRNPPLMFTVTTADEAREHLGAGDSLLVDDAGASIPHLREIASVMSSRFGVRGDACDVKLSISPPGGGLFPHFDQHDTIQVHLSGTKRWALSNSPAVPSPLEAYAFGTEPGEGLLRYCARDELNPPVLDEVILARGDVLTVPRGCWHRTIAEAESVGLIVRFAAAPWLDLLREEYRLQAIGNAAWREPAYGAWSDTGSGRRAAAHLRELVEQSFDGDYSVLTSDLPSAAGSAC